MLIAFFDSRSLIYQPICQPKTKDMSQYHLKVLQQLKNHIRQKHVDIRHNWNLHQNIIPHVAALVTTCLESQNIDSMMYHPYSPDTAQCYFWLFPSLKKALCDRRFQSDKKVITTTQTFFKSLSMEEFLQTILPSWKIHPQSWSLLRKRSYFKYGAKFQYRDIEWYVRMICVNKIFEGNFEIKDFLWRTE